MAQLNSESGCESKSLRLQKVRLDLKHINAPCESWWAHHADLALRSFAYR